MSGPTGNAAADAPVGGSAAPTPTRGQRLFIAAIAVLAIAVVAVVLALNRQESDSVPEQVTDAYVEAWNARDAQAVSGLTCAWVGSFTPAGVVEEYFRFGPAEGPFVTDYSITGVEQTTLSGRQVAAVRLEYVRGDGGAALEGTVYVREDDHHKPCVVGLTTW
jgi:hypothetical protein